MPSTQFKLTKDGGLTRRLTLPDQPTWLALATRIESLFGIPVEKVAVAYEDGDGDEVTLSSHDELLDYYANVHKLGESVKFKVIDLSSLRSNRGGSAVSGDEQSSHGSSLQDDFGIGNMGPTMVIDVDDWERLPTLPNLRLFGMSDDSESEPHAFVEVLESDAGRNSNADQSERLTTTAGSTKDKGKGKATGTGTLSSATPKTSVASVVEEDEPHKPDLHVYDIAEAGNMSPRSLAAATPRLYAVNLEGNEPRYSAFGETLGEKAKSDSDSISTVTTTPNSPLLQEETASKPLPKTPSHLSFASPAAQPIPTFSTHTTPRAVPVTVERAAADHASEQGSTENRPSFVTDVANLVEALTAAFSTHPELSEGLRNIVANSVNGNYWAGDRDSILSAANNMKRTAEEMSDRASRFSQNIAGNSENDAVRRIAEALGGVFRTIGDFSSRAGPFGAGPTDVPMPPPPPPPHVVPVPPHPHFAPPPMPGSWPHPSDWHRGGPPSFPSPGAPPNAYGFGPMPPPPPGPGYRSFSAGSHGPGRWSGRRRGGWGMGGTMDDSNIPSQERRGSVRLSDRMFSPPQRSNTWMGGHGRAPYRPPPNLTEQTLGDHNEVQNAHESKAQLEAAKAFYRAEKDRFRKEKEDRRRSRLEAAEKRAEEGRSKNPDEVREETVVARIPLSNPIGPGPSKKGPYAEIYSVSAPQKITTVPNSGRSTAPMMFENVTSRLNDMGFTTETNPELLTIVNEQLYPNGQPTKLNEEQVLTKALEALRIRGTPSPRPSGSGLRLN